MAESIGERVDSFRSSYDGLKAFILLISAVIGVSNGGRILARSEDMAGDVPLAVGVGVAAFAAAYCLMAFFLWLAIRAFPVHVHRGGLRSYNAVGIYRSMSWSEMSAVKEVDYVGLRYYEITSSWTGRKILIPRFMADPPGFHARIARLVGAHHVLLRALGKAQGTSPAEGERAS